jgi:hypothetical protein
MNFAGAALSPSLLSPNSLTASSSAFVAAASSWTVALSASSTHQFHSIFSMFANIYSYFVLITKNYFPLQQMMPTFDIFKAHDWPAFEAVGVVTNIWSNVYLHEKTEIKRPPSDLVAGIIIHDSMVAKIPSWLSHSYYGLTHLDLTSVGLTSISRNDLEFANLQCLLVAKNPIRELPNDIFAGLKQLHQVIFDQNQIVKMSSQVLMQLKANHAALVAFINNPHINVIYKSDGSPPWKSITALGVDNQAALGVDNQAALGVDIDNQAAPDVQATPEGPAAPEVPTVNRSLNLLKFMYKNGSYADFTFTADSTVFPVHRVVLGPQSLARSLRTTRDILERERWKSKTALPPNSKRNT